MAKYVDGWPGCNGAVESSLCSRLFQVGCLLYRLSEVIVETVLFILDSRETLSYVGTRDLL
jgi:hypothetical protein